MTKVYLYRYTFYLFRFFNEGEKTKNHRLVYCSRLGHKNSTNGTCRFDGLKVYRQIWKIFFAINKWNLIEYTHTKNSISMILVVI